MSKWTKTSSEHEIPPSRFERAPVPLTFQMRSLYTIDRFGPPWTTPMSFDPGPKLYDNSPAQIQDE